MTATPPPPRDLSFELSLYESILAGDPANVEALMALGEACTQRGDHARGLAIDQRLARLRPADPIVHYNLACSYALLGRPDEAFGTLAQAADLGYADLAHLDKDSDLDALRADPRFQDVRRRLAARSQ